MSKSVTGCAWRCAASRWRSQPENASRSWGTTDREKRRCSRLRRNLTQPSRGKIAFYAGEKPLSLEEVKRRVGMVGHHTLLYEELTAEENLIFFAKLFGLADPAENARTGASTGRPCRPRHGPGANIFARHAAAPGRSRALCSPRPDCFFWTKPARGPRSGRPAVAWSDAQAVARFRAARF